MEESDPRDNLYHIWECREMFAGLGGAQNPEDNSVIIKGRVYCPQAAGDQPLGGLMFTDEVWERSDPTILEASYSTV